MRNVPTGGLYSTQNMSQMTTFEYPTHLVFDIEKNQVHKYLVTCQKIKCYWPAYFSFLPV